MKSVQELGRELDNMVVCGVNKNCSYEEYMDKVIDLQVACIAEDVDQSILDSFKTEFIR